MRRTIWVFAAALLFVHLASGGDGQIRQYANTRHVIGVRGGALQIKEENLLSRVHAGLVVGASYEARRERGSFQDFQFDFQYCRPKAKPEESALSAAFNLNTAYSYCTRVVDKKGVTLFIGPRARIAYSAAYYPNWDDSHLYWADSYSAGVKSVLVFTFKNNTRLFSTLSTPIFSVFSRPEMTRLFKFDGTDFGHIWRNLNSHLRPGFWDHAFFMQFSAEYQFPILGTKCEAFTYSLDYARIRRSSGEPFQELVHQFGLKVML